MAKATKTKVAAATEVAAAIDNQLVATPTEAPATEGVVFLLQERVEEAKARLRGYSQSAITKTDLERLNALKAHLKEHHKLNVSNQLIIEAALDALAENMDEFLKKLLADANAKSRDKDLKQLEILKAKLAINDEA